MTETVHAKEIKAAELRGYSRGYQAGNKRKRREDEARALEAKRRSFADRVFLALLPVAMQVQGWKFGEKPIATGDDRIELAVIWAKRAAAQRYRL